MASPSSTPPTGRGWRRSLLRLGLFAGVCYLGVVGVLLFLENALVYHPVQAQESWQSPTAAVAAQEVWLTTTAGTRIHALWLPCPGASTALLYCHGNGGNLSHRPGQALLLLQALHASVLLFDYPGYGLSDGKPSEAGCHAAADAAYDWLAQQVPPDQIVLYGKSLGGGVAVELATRRSHHSLVLVKTFTSLPDVAQAQIPWLPARWLMRNRFNNVEKIGRCPRPIFIAHGDCDRLIPLAQGQRLYELAPEPKRFFLMAGCDHNGGLPPDCLSAMADFLQSVRATPQTATASN